MIGLHGGRVPVRPTPRSCLLATVLGQGLLLAPVLLLPPGGVRTIATVVYLVGAPALPVFLSLTGLDLLLRAVLGGSVAVVVNTVVAEFMVVTRNWSIVGGIVAVGVASVAIALVGFGMSRETHRQAAGGLG